ncbi:hypothetical protein R6Q59_012648 [Mikania micrantha]
MVNTRARGGGRTGGHGGGLGGGRTNPRPQAPKEYQKKEPALENSHHEENEHVFEHTDEKVVLEPAVREAIAEEVDQVVELILGFAFPYFCLALFPVTKPKKKKRNGRKIRWWTPPSHHRYHHQGQISRVSDLAIISVSTRLLSAKPLFLPLAPSIAPFSPLYSSNYLFFSSPLASSWLSSPHLLPEFRLELLFGLLKLIFVYGGSHCHPISDGGAQGFGSGLIYGSHFCSRGDVFVFPIVQKRAGSLRGFSNGGSQENHENHGENDREKQMGIAIVRTDEK